MCRCACRQWPAVDSALEGEAAGPGRLARSSQGHLQEGERLELAGARQRAGIDGAQPGCGDELGELRLRRGVAAGEGNGGRLVPDGAAARVAPNVVLNAFTTRASGSAAAI
jgi:hypothetical protein